MEVTLCCRASLCHCVPVSRYLYREQFSPVPCPAILSGSHTLSYSEYDTASAEYLVGCGEPRSEVNSCHQRYEEDPQVMM